MLISFVYMLLGQAAATTTAAADDDNNANNGVNVAKHLIGSDRTGIVVFGDEQARSGGNMLATITTKVSLSAAISSLVASSSQSGCERHHGSMSKQSMLCDINRNSTARILTQNLNWIFRNSSVTRVCPR